MKHILSLVFAALLGLASCSKNNSATPEQATIVAKWQIDSTWVTDGTQAGLTQKLQLQVFRPAPSIKFTSTHYLLYNGTLVDEEIAYTVTNNIIHLGGSGGINDRTIQVLTPHRMVLVGLRDVTPLNPLAVHFTTYSR